ncbi:MAG TPA: thiamine phosphate synthase [Kofleriaceae bacterium]|nr:thiamine phosphate synthase [Kofleriaceae bacterium]
MNAGSHVRGFYGILDQDSSELAHVLLAGGARVLQLRLKPDTPLSTRDLLAAAQRARSVCRAAGVMFVVNDRLDVALAVRADGLHLGQTDLPLVEARRVARGAGHPLIIGVSTHDAGQVRAALSDGADYLGYGPVFATPTKRDPDPVQGLEALATAVALAGPVPVVAIGGITPDLADAVALTGAAAACAIASVNRAADPTAAAVRITRAFAGAAPAAP